jgi:hypothetical protein
LRPVLRSSILFSISLALGAAAGSYAQTPSKILTKDDLLFRRETYTDKKGNKMPYRLYAA